MRRDVVLSIRGRQTYADQEPEVIELVTEGVMELHDGGWDIRYEESELTGLEGVTTTFRVEPGKVILTRAGKLSSQMVFQEGVVHESLYEVDGFGIRSGRALMKLGVKVKLEGDFDSRVIRFKKIKERIQ